MKDFILAMTEWAGIAVQSIFTKEEAPEDNNLSAEEGAWWAVQDKIEYHE